MIRRDVDQNRGEQMQPLYRFQLKAAQLDHGEPILPQGRDQRDQRRYDISAYLRR